MVLSKTRSPSSGLSHLLFGLGAETVGTLILTSPLEDLEHIFSETACVFVGGNKPFPSWAPFRGRVGCAGCLRCVLELVRYKTRMFTYTPGTIAEEAFDGWSKIRYPKWVALANGRTKTCGPIPGGFNFDPYPHARARIFLYVKASIGFVRVKIKAPGIGPQV